ncbi:MAG TPA: helix-turn-helix domain-containing protein [Gaiellaceae bacterium]|nr:helix-turn-helix domain-containing protein [Gaiellaceae bacterium]
MRDDDGNLSKRHAAEWLDVSERTIDRLRAEGEVEAFRAREGVRIPLASLRAYRRRQQRGRSPLGDRFGIPALEAIRAQKAARGEEAA